jgi:prepilin-type N-terminal cleavage/methylation domain-containing protein
MKQLGFSLLEVLLALVIFSIGILAALKAEKQAEQQEEASQLQIQAAMQAQYAVALTQSANKQLIPAWQKAIAKELPKGKANIIEQDSKAIIHISWWDPVFKYRVELSYAVPISKWRKPN